MSGGLQIVRALLALLVGAVIGGIGLGLMTILILWLVRYAFPRLISWENGAAEYVFQFLFFSVSSGALLGAVTGLIMSLSFAHRLHAAGWVSLTGGVVLLALNLAVFWFWISPDKSITLNFKNCLGLFCAFHGLSGLWAVALVVRGLLFLRS